MQQFNQTGNLDIIKFKSGSNVILFNWRLWIVDSLLGNVDYAPQIMNNTKQWIGVMNSVVLERSHHQSQSKVYKNEKQEGEDKMQFQFNFLSQCFAAVLFLISHMEKWVTCLPPKESNSDIHFISSKICMIFLNAKMNIFSLLPSSLCFLWLPWEVKGSISLSYALRQL